ncbi:50S ribosomal protein L23 [Patescibacteria group bacterium]|nr:50S ribosomal protein L23 [Patescibacteria group bacterium]
MGLLNKWFKNKEKEQLEAVEKQEASVGVEEKKIKPEDKKVDTKKEIANPKEENKSKKETTKETKIVKTKVKEKNVRADEILVKPIISEKAARQEGSGIYSFVVNTTTNKVEIKKAIQQIYGVKPAKVRIINIEGKKTRFGRRLGRRGDTKKAIIYLPKGQSINIHEGV